MDCKQTEERLSEYIENELPENLRLEIKTHIDHCPRCRELHDDLTELIRTGPDLSEAVPFYLKNRLLYIPELMEIETEEPAPRQGLKFIAAMIGTIILLLNLFYFTNIYPQGHYFLHKTISRIERFAIDTKEYIFQQDSVKNNFFIAFIDKNIISSGKEGYLTFDGENRDQNGKG